ncbi:MAG: DUF4349 domain-containing protein [Rikenellaceae bacterium]|jgi:hypothetical protein|nr:DUF4349 domain-containing protein [Rikenellaceae bacterium]
MKNPLQLAALLLLATACSCGNRGYSPHAETAMTQEEALDTRGETPVNPQNAVLKRKIIKEGEISFETSNARKTRELILVTVAENNGYLSDDNASNYGGRSSYTVTIRVPSDRFETLLHAIAEYAGKLESKNIRALDVTEEFVDIEARLRTKKELEERYRDLLKRANTVEEVLSVEREIGTLRSDIESVEGRLKYLRDRVSYSSLTVSFHESGDDAFGFGGKFIRGIESGWQNLLRFVIGLVNLWPFILLGAGAIFGFRRWRKRKRGQK